MTAYDNIKEGLTEAINFSRSTSTGKPSGTRVHCVEVPQVDVTTAHPELAEGSAPEPASR